MAEILPPLTAEDVKGPLSDPTLAVYMYVGNEADAGWDNAQLASGFLAKLRVYLVKDITLIREWVTDGTPRGVIFGWGDKPVRFLNETEAKDPDVVLSAIREACP